MRRRSLTPVVVFAFILSASTTLLSQFSERIDVHLHQLDVIVETRKGTLVTDLQKDDFEVRQDGVLQPITNFSLISESMAQSRATPEEGGQVRQAPPPPRKFVFFVDEFPIHDATRDDILRQMSDLLGTMRADDEAMVMTPAAREHIQLLFTNDKRAVMRTLERVTTAMMRKGDVHALDGSPEILLRGDCGQSAEACAKRRLATLSSISRALGQVPGRKVIVLLTMRMSSVPGMRLKPQVAPGAPPPAPTSGPARVDPRAILGPDSILPDFRNLQREVAAVGRIAASNNVPIYGLEAYEPGLAALPGMSVEQSSPTLASPAHRGNDGTIDLLLTLARETGARAYSGTRESDNMFEQIASDLSTYYSIAYRETDPEPKKKTHRIEVRVRNRPDLVVRTRRIVAPRDEKQEVSDRAIAALLTANPQNALGIGTRAKHPVRRGRLVEMPVEIRVPIRRLTFVQEAKGYRSRFMAHIAAVGTQTDFGSTQMDHEQELFIADAKWEKSQQEHFTFNVSVRLKPGKYRLAVGVTDTASRESGFQVFSVTSP